MTEKDYDIKEVFAIPLSVLRDLFALTYMQANADVENLDLDRLAHQSYVMADCMLKAREKTTKSDG